MNKIILYGIAQEEKQIAIFEVIENKVKCYDGHKYGELTMEAFKEMKSKPRSSSHLFIKKEEKDDVIKRLSLRKQHKYFMKEAEIIKIATNGKLNRFKTGTFAKTAINFFNTFDLPKLAPIQNFEAEIIESCYNGGLIWGIPYKGKGYKYDVTSQYPSILRASGFSIPTDEGKLETYTQKQIDEAPFFQIGIYHVEILNTDFRLFRTSSKNYYVHTELARARELKYPIKIIEDGKPNVLRYYKFIASSTLFKGYIDYLYQLKSKGIKSAKKYLNVLPGALCQSDVMTINTSQKDQVIYAEKEILTLRPMGSSINSQHLQADVYRPTKRYEYYYARIKPFLVAKGRMMISRIIEKNLKHVVRCHTDGIILKKRIKKSTPLGSDIGDLKFEGKSEKCEIINAISYNGFDDDKETVDIFDQLKKEKEIALKFATTFNK